MSVLARDFHARMLEQYRQGIVDGVRMALDHIEGIEAGGVPYRGELPDELRAYIARTRKALLEGDAA